MPDASVPPAIRPSAPSTAEVSPDLFSALRDRAEAVAFAWMAVKVAGRRAGAGEALSGALDALCDALDGIAEAEGALPAGAGRSDG